MGFAAGFAAGYKTVSDIKERKEKREQEAKELAIKKAKEIKEQNSKMYQDSSEKLNEINKLKEEAIKKRAEIMSSKAYATPKERADAYNSFQDTLKSQLDTLATQASNSMGAVSDNTLVDNLSSQMQSTLGDAPVTPKFQEIKIGDKSTFVDEQSFEALMENPSQFKIGKDNNIYKVDKDGSITNELVAEGKNFNGIPTDDKDSLVKTWNPEKGAYEYVKKELGTLVSDKPEDKDSKYGKQLIDVINKETGEKEKVTQETYFSNKSNYGIPRSESNEFVVVMDKNGNKVAQGVVSEEKLLDYTNQGYTVTKQFKDTVSGNKKTASRDNFIIYDRSGNPIKTGYMTEEKAVDLAEKNNGSIELAAKGGIADANEEIVKTKKRKAQNKFKISQMNRTIKNAIEIINENPDTTAGWGALLKIVPTTKSKDLSNLVSELKANVSFSTLNNMREASPTGGALGSVTEGELTLLGNSQSAFEQSQDSESLKKALKTLQYNFNAAINGGDYIDPDTGEVISREEITSENKESKPVAKAGTYDVYKDEKGYYIIVNGVKKYKK